MADPSLEKKDVSGGDLPAYRSEETSHEPLSEKAGSTDSTSDGDEPTAEEKATLRRVGEMLPARIWLVAIVELCERFTYYGMQGLFQNYVSHAKDGSEGAAGLGKFLLFYIFVSMHKADIQ